MRLISQSIGICPSIINVNENNNGEKEEMDDEEENQELFFGPYDLEGHIGAVCYKCQLVLCNLYSQDGRYYFLDTARLFPPEAPCRDK